MQFTFLVKAPYLFALTSSIAWRPSEGLLYFVMVLGSLLAAGVFLSVFTFVLVCCICLVTLNAASIWDVISFCGVFGWFSCVCGRRVFWSLREQLVSDMLCVPRTESVFCAS